MSDYIKPPQIAETKTARAVPKNRLQTEGEFGLEHYCRIRVPASSGNLGPGFDTLGLALNLHNYFEIYLDTPTTGVEIFSGIEPELFPKGDAMVKEAAECFFRNSALPKRHFRLSIHNNIPIARGLASSATVRLAVLCGLNYLLKAAIHTNDLVKWASNLEGCTDNIAACYFGGLTASGIINEEFVCYRFDLDDDVDFVAVSPVTAVETNNARNVFSGDLPREDAVFNLNRGILLAMAFARGDYESMRHLFEDRIHQPQRQAGIPALKSLYEVIEAAQNAGAIGAFLSGSGSTMMAITREKKEQVARAMQTIIARHNMTSTIHYLKADNTGLLINP